MRFVKKKKLIKPFFFIIFFYVSFSLKYKLISHLFCHFPAFNRFCWVQMPACLEECLEWCLLLLESCDDVSNVTSMSCRRRGKREGAGTGEKKMLWLVNIKKSFPCIDSVQWRSWWLYELPSLSAFLTKTFCIDWCPSSDLLLFYYSYLITCLSERDYGICWEYFDCVVGALYF